MYTLENKEKVLAVRILTNSPDRSRTPIVTLRPDRIGLLADDLTGACDAAAAFLHTGHSVRVWCGSKALSLAPETVQAFNTASRELSPAQAAAAVTQAVAALDIGRNSFILKKIDSAARGPLAAELLAAQRGLGSRAILLAPSFPAAGRTVRNGILDIQDVSGQKRQLSLAALFPEEIQPQIALVSRPDRLAAAVHSGKSILLCDATTQGDLEQLLHCAADFDGLLYAGSAGLARAMASTIIRPGHLPEAPLPAAARTLVIVGTPHPVTRLQLERIPPDRLDGSHAAAKILCIRCEGGDKDRVRVAFENYNPQALLLTGGDTARLAADALDAHSFILRGELAPGIPWGAMEGGPGQGRTVITKSGGFGSPTAFRDILNLLSGQL